MKFGRRYLQSCDYLALFIASCLAIAGIGHVVDIWCGGWLPYSPAPYVLNAYWSSLAAADIVAAVLLMVRLRIGVIVTLTILISDVMINSYATYQMHILEGGWGLQLQTLFLGFVLGSTPSLWRKAKSIN